MNWKQRLDNYIEKEPDMELTHYQELVDDSLNEEFFAETEEFINFVEACFSEDIDPQSVARIAEKIFKT